MITLAKYIVKSENIGRNDAEQLEILREKYMYFQALHILIAKSHKNQNTFGFNKNLRIASMYAGDRRILYDFINKESKTPEEELPNDSEIENLIQLQIEEPEIEKIENNITTIPQTQPDFENSVDKNDFITEVLINENNKNTALEEKQEDIIETDLLASEIENTLINIPEETEAQIEKTELEAENEIAEIVETENSEITETIIEDNIIVISSEEAEIKEVSDELNKNEMSFFEWLDKFDNNESQTIVSDLQDEDELNNNISVEIEQINQEEDEYDPVSWAEIAYEIQAFVKHPENTEQSKKENLTKEEVDNILDNFLSKNPSISRPKAEFYKPENMARKSEEFHAEVVSETLANLFYKQGQLHKALEMFEKLMLQSPNKNDIFALKIQKIKEELINKL